MNSIQRSLSSRSLNGNIQIFRIAPRTTPIEKGDSSRARDVDVILSKGNSETVPAEKQQKTAQTTRLRVNEVTITLRLLIQQQLCRPQDE